MHAHAPKEIKIPQVLIASTNHGAGLSTFIMGLLVNLKRAGVAAAIGKVGNSLTDTTFHRRISGRLSHTLDFWLLSRGQVANAIARLTGGAELVILEGDGGLFDSLGDDASYPNLAAFARDRGIPIVLVFDASGYRESAAALVNGFAKYAEGVDIAGVVANKVRDTAQHEAIKKALAALDGPEFLGSIPLGDSTMVSANQAGQGANPSLFTRNRLIAVGDLVQQSINLQTIRDIAAQAKPFLVEPSVVEGMPRRCRIAVADDAAFHLTIQDNLDLMRRVGAEIVAFSPLADLRLPHKTGGVYLPGGYVHLYAADLAANQSMLQALRDFARSGGVIYAEGAAVAYLSRKATLYDGQSFDMVGLLQATTTSVVDDNTYVAPSPCEIVTREDTILSPVGTQFRGVRDPRWLIRLDKPVLSCFQVRDGARTSSASEVTPTLEGFSPTPHVLITAIQGHWGSQPQIARLFVDSVTASVPSMRFESEANSSS